MYELAINGNKKLFGDIEIQGSKNAVLPIMAATLLTDEECVIHNCPNISDTKAAAEILSSIGGFAEINGDTVTVKASDAMCSTVPQELMKKMRSSVMFLGPLLNRCKRAVICMPGGCKLGERPIDMHIDALEKMGADITENGDCIVCSVEKISGGSITLLYPSVGVTENVMLMGAVSDSVIYLHNPAREPEIVDLQNFLNSMGADISGAGTDLIIIRGVKKLHGCEYRVMSDRIVAATYACAVASCGGKINLLGVSPMDLKVVLEALKTAGCRIFESENKVTLESDGELNAIRSIKTLPYPGFPTDVQPMLVSALSVADGISRIKETVFDSRYRYVTELKKMGADITIDGDYATINGVPCLNGTRVNVSDLRGGAALVVAGLSAKGITVISGTEYIDRGYDKLDEALVKLGADIKRIRI